MPFATPMPPLSGTRQGSLSRTLRGCARRRRRLAAACAAAIVAGGVPALQAQARIYPVASAVTDRVQRPVGADVLASVRAQGLNAAREGLDALLGEIGRCRPLAPSTEAQGDAVVLGPSPTTEYLVHLVVRKLGKTYRVAPTRIDDGSSGDLPLFRPMGGAYEMLAVPAIFCRFEMQLLRWPDEKVIWSALRDSAQVIPCDERIFLYNPGKYPGWTHPAVLARYMSGIVRLQDGNRGLATRLQQADRWLVSEVAEDLRTARDLARGTAAAFRTDLDAHLPLESRVTAVLGAGGDGERVEIGIGTRHGLHTGLRLEVRRPGTPEEEIGEVEVIQVDSAAAVARIRKLDRSLRQRDEGLRVGDRVLSRERRLN